MHGWYGVAQPENVTKKMTSAVMFRIPTYSFTSDGKEGLSQPERPSYFLPVAGLRASRRFAPCMALHFSSARKPINWLSPPKIKIAFRQFNLWAGRESNPHALRHTILSRACLPFHHSPKRLYFSFFNIDVAIKLAYSKDIY